jgi:hypothetical protein
MGDYGRAEQRVIRGFRVQTKDPITAAALARRLPARPEQLRRWEKSRLPDDESRARQESCPPISPLPTLHSLSADCSWTAIEESQPAIH